MSRARGGKKGLAGLSGGFQKGVSTGSEVSYIRDPQKKYPRFRRDLYIIRLPYFLFLKYNTSIREP